MCTSRLATFVANKQPFEFLVAALTTEPDRAVYPSRRALQVANAIGLVTFRSSWSIREGTGTAGGAARAAAGRTGGGEGKRTGGTAAAGGGEEERERAGGAAAAGENVGGGGRWREKSRAGCPAGRFFGIFICAHHVSVCSLHDGWALGWCVRLIA